MIELDIIHYYLAWYFLRPDCLLIRIVPAEPSLEGNTMGYLLEATYLRS